MAISSRACGELIGENEALITVRQTLAYAAGIGDTSVAVLDDARGDLVAPPQMCVSLEWPVVSHQSSRDRLAASSDELRRGVHVVQDSIFHRPIRPGDRLVTQGRFLSFRATRAGALLTTRLETTNASTNEPVVTSWSTSIYRGVELADTPREPPPQDDLAPPLPAVSSNGHGETAQLFIPREMPHVYTECASIWNPIHTEREVALAAGLPDIILHGTATWALAGREIIQRYGQADPRRLKRLHGEFRSMIIPGTEITIELEPSPKTGHERVVGFTVRNQAGEEAIRNGIAVLSTETQSL